MVSEELVVAAALALDGVVEKERSEERPERKMRLFYREQEGADAKMFLCIHEGTNPLRLELRCDGRLSKTLQERYESVMESRALGRGGIEVICSGQLDENDVLDLVRHAYEMSV